MSTERRRDIDVIDENELERDSYRKINNDSDFDSLERMEEQRPAS